MSILARMRAALTRRAARHRANRALYRLARESCGAPDCPTCLALHHIAHTGDHVHTAATEDEQRDPDYCWTCGRKCGSQAHR